MKIKSHSAVFSAYSDMSRCCLVTQHWHIKRRHTRQIRWEERLLDSCLPGWVTLLQDPLRGAQPWVTSLPQSGRKDFKRRTCATPHLSLGCLLLLLSWAPQGISEDHPSSHHVMNQFCLPSRCHHAPVMSLFCSIIRTYCPLTKETRNRTWSPLVPTRPLSSSFVSSWAAAIGYCN